MEISLKNLADIIVQVTDPVEELDYKFNTIEDLLTYLCENGHKKLILKKD